MMNIMSGKVRRCKSLSPMCKSRAWLVSRSARLCTSTRGSKYVTEKSVNLSDLFMIDPGFLEKFGMNFLKVRISYKKLSII